MKNDKCQGWYQNSCIYGVARCTVPDKIDKYMYYVYFFLLGKGKYLNYFDFET